MADDSEFLSRLISFGLSEKEAQAYLHLLKYGPKPPTLLAKSLKTYREDVHRTLNALIDKGMVNPSLETPTVYAAVELETALDAAVRKHESELREMEMRKQELQELSKQQRFRPSDEFATFKILKSVKDVMTISTTSMNSAEREFLACVNEVVAVTVDLFGFNEEANAFVDRGGNIRILTDISYSMTELVQRLLDIGEDIRHISHYSGVMFVVFDRKTSISAINVDIKHMSLNEPLSCLWSDDPTNANYLVSTFEMLWERSIPAAQRIEELLKEGPPQT